MLGLSKCEALSLSLPPFSGLPRRFWLALERMPSEVETRYGKPQNVFAEAGKFRDVGYAFERFSVVVNFIDGISRREGFAFPDQSPLTDDAIKQILAVSAGDGATWEEVTPQDGARLTGVAPTGRRLRSSKRIKNPLYVQDRDVRGQK